MSSKFHGAARDNDLGRLKEATKKDCNTKDEDGMTPTLCAAFEGHLDALRVLVGRGGDPDKCDNFGNTALHFATAKGHMQCVTFLVNFGVNIWSQDVDGHTPKELAAMNGRDDILNYLDEFIARQDKKTAKSQKEKATKDREKVMKNFAKVHKKAQEEAQKEQKRLGEIRKKMDTAQHEDMGPLPAGRPSVAALTMRRDSRQIYGATPKFSELVNSDRHGAKKPMSSVFKKAQAKKKSGFDAPQSQAGSVRSLNGVIAEGDFKVGGFDSDGTRTVRSIRGLRRDSEVIFVTDNDDSTAGQGKRGKITDVFDGTQPLTKSKSDADFLQSTDSGFGEDMSMFKSRQSIFDRPGFGTMAFRNSITATLSALSTEDNPSSPVPTSVGSAGSLERRAKDQGPWDDRDIESDEEDSAAVSQLVLFLAASGLTDLLPVFANERIDLDSVMLLTDSDLTGMGIPLGPRKKLMKAIADRAADIEDPGEVDDSYL